jgi:hypothetical protein
LPIVPVDVPPIVLVLMPPTVVFAVPPVVLGAVPPVVDDQVVISRVGARYVVDAPAAIVVGKARVVVVDEEIAVVRR